MYECNIYCMKNKEDKQDFSYYFCKKDIIYLCNVFLYTEQFL